MKIFYTLSILIILTFNICLGQNNTQTNDLDNIYTPPTGSVLDSKTFKVTKSSSDYIPINQSKNVIQFNLATLLCNNVFVTYERAMGSQFSVVAGLGTYYGRDYIGFFGNEMMNEMKSSDEGTTNHYRLIWDPTNTTLLNGDIQLGLSGRYYLDDKFESREYIELGYKYYSWTFKPNANNAVFQGTPELIINNQLLFFNYAQQWCKGNDKVKFVQEFYSGIGLRIYEYDVLTDFNNGSSTLYRPTNIRKSEFGLSFLLGYKIGFGW